MIFGFSRHMYGGYYNTAGRVVAWFFLGVHESGVGKISQYHFWDALTSVTSVVLDCILYFLF